MVKKMLDKIALKKALFLLDDFSWALLIHNCIFVLVHTECKWAQIIQEERKQGAKGSGSEEEGGSPSAGRLFLKKVAPN